MPKSWLRFGMAAVGAAAIVVAAGFGVSAAKPDEKVQHLTGAYARAHMLRKEAKSNEFRQLRAQARARFAVLGIEPTGEILVSRRETVKKTGILARFLDKIVPSLLADEYWEGGGQEMIFESYRSGYNTQWLGWAYHESLSDGWWMSGDVRVDFAPTMADPNVDPYILWTGGVENQTEEGPYRISRGTGPVGRLAQLVFPTLFAQVCGAPKRAIFRTFVRAGFAQMRADNTTNWLTSVFAGAAGGPAGFAISALGLFGVSYGRGYMDAMWNYTKKCPGWYW